MELSAMEKLSLLEKKVLQICELIKLEKERNAKLVQEKSELATKLEQLETSLLTGSKSLEELNQEKMLTKLVVDELITSIDTLIQQEKQ